MSSLPPPIPPRRGNGRLTKEETARNTAMKGKKPATGGKPVTQAQLSAAIAPLLRLTAQAGRGIHSGPLRDRHPGPPVDRSTKPKKDMSPKILIRSASQNYTNAAMAAARSQKK
jgi:hypothetical protein